MIKKLLFFFLLSTTILAQSPPTPVSYEVVTFDNTVAGIGFSAATLTVGGQQVRTCEGTLEGGSIRFRVDGLAAPTTTNGHPLVVGQNIRIDGFTTLTKFRGIRVTGTDGIIRFTCAR